MAIDKNTLHAEQLPLIDVYQGDDEKIGYPTESNLNLNDLSNNPTTTEKEQYYRQYSVINKSWEPSTSAPDIATGLNENMRKVTNVTSMQEMTSVTTNIQNYINSMMMGGSCLLWNSKIPYNKNAIVTYERNGALSLHLSLINDNKGNDPFETENVAWAVFSAGGSGGGGGREIGEIVWMDHEIHYEASETPKLIKANGQLLQLDKYFDFRQYLLNLELTNPNQFANSYDEWLTERQKSCFDDSLGLTGQINKYCWGDAEKNSVYMKCIYDITGLIRDSNNEIQKQEVPTGSLGDMLGNINAVSDLNPTGAFTVETSQQLGASHSATDAYVKYTYDPQKAGGECKNYAENGKNVRQEAVKGYFYIQAMGLKTQNVTMFSFAGTVDTFDELPDPTGAKNKMFYVKEEEKHGYYASNGDKWCYITDSYHEIETAFTVGTIVEMFNQPINPSWVKCDDIEKSGSMYTTLYSQLQEAQQKGEDITITVNNKMYTVKQYGNITIGDIDDYQKMIAETKHAPIFALQESNMSFYTPCLAIDRTLTASQDATGEKNEWFKLYSDGYVEQGITIKFPSLQGNWVEDMQFSIPFKDNNYELTVTPSRNDIDNACAYAIRCSSKTRESVQVGFYQRSADLADMITIVARGFTETQGTLQKNCYCYAGNQIINQAEIDIGNVLQDLQTVKASSIKQMSVTSNSWFVLFHNNFCIQGGDISDSEETYFQRPFNSTAYSLYVSVAGGKNSNFYPSDMTTTKTSSAFFTTKMSKLSQNINGLSWLAIGMVN